MGSKFRSDLLRGGIGSLIVKASHAFLAFLVAVFVARLLGPEGYGVYSFALAIITIVALPAQVGLPQLVVRETAKSHSVSDWPLMRGLWAWSNRAALFFSILAMIGLWAFAQFIVSSPRLETLIVGVVLVPLIALGNLRAACLRGLRLVTMGQLPESVIRPLVFLLILIAVSSLNGVSGLRGPDFTMGAYVVSATIAFIIGSIMLRLLRPRELKLETRWRTLPKEWRSAILPLAMIAGLQLINNQADIVILGMLRTDGEVGIYRAATQVALLVVFGLQAINQVLQPYFAGLYKQGDLERLQRLVTVSTWIILALAIPPALVFVFFGADLLGWVFGDAYRIGAVPLAILAAGQGVKAWAGTSYNLLNMTGFERVTAKISIVAVVVNLAGNFTLIPFWGTSGAAVATAVSSSIWFLLMSQMTKKHCNIVSLAIPKLTIGR